MTTVVTEAQQEWISAARAMLGFAEAHPEFIPPDDGFEVRLNATHRYRDLVLALAEGGDVTISKENGYDLVHARLFFGPHKITLYAGKREAGARTIERTIEDVVPFTLDELRAAEAEATTETAVAP